MNNLLPEILDIILEKFCLLLLVGKQKTCENSDCSLPRDKELIASFLSVSSYWYRRMKNRVFKKTFWRHLSVYYRNLYKGAAIIRNNRNFLGMNMKSVETLIDKLRSANCLTDVQVNLLNKIPREKDKNIEILRTLRFRYDDVYTSFIRCLRETNQHLLARVVERGGVTMDLKIKTKIDRNSDEGQLATGLSSLEENMFDHFDEGKRILSSIKETGMEILMSHEFNRFFCFIWCKSPSALRALRNKQKRGFILHMLSRLLRGCSIFLQPKHVSLSGNLLSADFVSGPVFLAHYKRGFNPTQWSKLVGLTVLHTTIYVLCLFNSQKAACQIRSFENRDQFHICREFGAKKIRNPTDIGSSDIENCLYIMDCGVHCIWKITDLEGSLKFTKWLSFENYWSYNFSMTKNDQLLLVGLESPRSDFEVDDGLLSTIKSRKRSMPNADRRQLSMVNTLAHRPAVSTPTDDYGQVESDDSRATLAVFGPDGNAIISIQLNDRIGDPLHAIETSKGTYLILHTMSQRKIRMRPNDIPKDWTSRELKLISEVTRDGQNIICEHCFTEHLKDPVRISTDSEDRVFVAGFNSVILLDPDLCWNNFLLKTTDAYGRNRPTSERNNQSLKLYYHKEEKHLFVGGVRTRARNRSDLGEGFVGLYTVIKKW